MGQAFPSMLRLKHLGPELTLAALGHKRADLPGACLSCPWRPISNCSRSKKTLPGHGVAMTMSHGLPLRLSHALKHGKVCFKCAHTQFVLLGLFKKY